jgi:hypothetical protein
LKGSFNRFMAALSVLTVMAVGFATTVGATVVPIDLSANTTAAVNGGAGLIGAATSSFNSVWPYILAVIATVFLAFWVLNRVKKGAAGAK